MDWDCIRYFKRSEFACPCCGACEMDKDFVMFLDMARHVLGDIVTITSGYRCAKHNKKVGGVPDSAHTKGLAADLAVPSSAMRYDMIQILQRLFERVGIGKTFIHVDMDLSKPRPAMWVY